MMDPTVDPYANLDDNISIEKFGASDIFDLNRIQLLNAYIRTENGRCTWNKSCYC